MPSSFSVFTGADETWAFPNIGETSPTATKVRPCLPATFATVGLTGDGKPLGLERVSLLAARVGDGAQTRLLKSALFHHARPRCPPSPIPDPALNTANYE